ncbi:MAG: alpha/beta hydrolase family protein [Candidatus Hodarchaeota archaeon]
MSKKNEKTRISLKERVKLYSSVACEFLRGTCDPDSKYYMRLEEKVPEYTLPDPLVMDDGTKVETKENWVNKRRPEILELFKTNVYGKSPDPPKELDFKVTLVDESVFNGLATRKEVEITLTGEGKLMDLLLHIPNVSINAGKQVPAFLGLNFYGNQTIHDDPCITLKEEKTYYRLPLKGRGPISRSRGIRKDRWQLEHVLKNGYALGTIYYCDIFPDIPNGLPLSIIPHFFKKEQTQPAVDEWGAISAWAWGLSRGLDYLEKDEHVDAERVAVIGHSRLGKTALWAAAQDERFTIAISNNSGCGGAAISRRHMGETVKRINDVFPHWFCDNFKQYNEKEGDLPVDQHMLISLIAPRPVYVASSQKDLWADPLGEFLGALHADPVYRLLDTEGLPVKKMPKVNKPIAGRIGYHMKKGRHSITLYDWKEYIKFANKHFNIE